MKRRIFPRAFEMTGDGNAFLPIPCLSELSLIGRGADNRRQSLPTVEIGVKQGARERRKVSRAKHIDAPMRARQSHTRNAGSADIEPLIDWFVLRKRRARRSGERDPSDSSANQGVPISYS